MNIAEFRQKYPAYNDMSDKDLADKFHAKYYSDIDRTEFDRKFLGENPESSEDQQRVSKLKESMGPVSMGQAQAASVPPLSFLEKLSKSASNIPSSVGNVATDFYNTVRHPVDTGVGLANMAAGGIASLVPKSMQTPESQQMSQSAEPLIEGARQFIKHPVDTIANRIVNNPAGYALDIAGLKSLSGLSGISKTPELAKVVEYGINKGIRPSVVGKNTLSQTKAYYAKAEDAVSSIVKNKENLALTTESGEKVAGLPKNLSQFREAVDQTKKSIFKQYDEMTKSAGSAGATVDTQPIVDELFKIASAKDIETLHPEVSNFALNQAKRYEKMKVLTAEEAQNEIARLNSQLDTFYKNGKVSDVMPSTIKAMIKNNIREGLDNVITSAVGPGYQELKTRYGSLKAIEKEVNHRATVDARKNVKGLVDFSDIYSASQVLGSVMGGGPAGLAKGVATEGIKMWYKHLNNPNTHISNMFDKADKIINNKITTKDVLGPLASFDTLQASRLQPAKEEQTKNNFLTRALAR